MRDGGVIKRRGGGKTDGLGIEAYTAGNNYNHEKGVEKTD